MESYLHRETVRNGWITLAQTGNCDLNVVSGGLEEREKI